MPLVSMKTLIQNGREQHFAVPLFDVPSLNAAIGAVEAAEAVNAPVILGMYNAWFDLPEAPAVCAGLHALAEGAKVPVSLMLDHCASYIQCIKAIRFGFTDVMFDGSSLPFEENLRITSLVREAAHAVGVGVEAELGHVGLGAEYEVGEARAHFTQPEMVQEFVSASGVDFLAVAFGTAHGNYKTSPQLDLDLLAQLNAVSTVPLVMHGGSGLSEDQFKGAIQGGIAKINVATHIFNEIEARTAQSAADGKTNLFAIEGIIRASFRELCTYYLQLFSAAGQA
jgi:ketose-bisphosphate aldolase